MGCRVEVARHDDDATQRDFTARKGQGNLKTVPAFQLDFPVQMIRYRHDGQAGELRQRNRAFRNDLARAARAVRGDGNVITAPGPRCQFTQRLRTPSAARSAHGLDAQIFKNLGE